MLVASRQVKFTLFLGQKIDQGFDLNQCSRPGFHNSAVILIPYRGQIPRIERNLIKEIIQHMGKQKGPQKFIHLHGKEFASSQIIVYSRREALTLSRKTDQLHSFKTLCMSSLSKHRAGSVPWYWRQEEAASKSPFTSAPT